jgi:hypothetical protein
MARVEGGGGAAHQDRAGDQGLQLGGLLQDVIKRRCDTPGSRGRPRPGATRGGRLPRLLGTARGLVTMLSDQIMPFFPWERSPATASAVRRTVRGVHRPRQRAPRW